jgi:hypothetical protein
MSGTFVGEMIPTRAKLEDVITPRVISDFPPESSDNPIIPILKISKSQTVFSVFFIEICLNSWTDRSIFECFRTARLKNDISENKLFVTPLSSIGPECLQEGRLCRQKARQIRTVF